MNNDLGWILSYLQNCHLYFQSTGVSRASANTGGALQFSSLPYSNPSRSTSFSHLPSPTSTTTKHQNLLRRRLSLDHRVNSPVRRRRLPGLGPPTLLPAIRLLRRLRRTQGLRHRFPNLPRLRRRRLSRHSAGVGGLLFSVDLRLIERPGLLSDRGVDVSFVHDFESNTAADGYVKRLEDELRFLPIFSFPKTPHCASLSNSFGSSDRTLRSRSLLGRFTSGGCINFPLTGNLGFLQGSWIVKQSSERKGASLVRHLKI